MIAGKLPVHREANIAQLQAQKQIRPHGQAPFKWPARSRSKLPFINMDRHGWLACKAIHEAYWLEYNSAMLERYDEEHWAWWDCTTVQQWKSRR
jgi:hypothetical protein